MISLEANTRNNKTKGELSSIRKDGNIPAIIYGGKNENEKISISKKILKTFIEKENFLSNIITLKINGKDQNVLPREVIYNVITDEPIHIDFLRVVPGVKIKIEVPVEFILNLEGVDIGESFKISSVKLDNEVTPTIQGRDFVIATLAAPTVIKEPEKPAEEEAKEGEEGAEGAEAAAAGDGEKSAAEGDKKEGDDKKPAEKKPADNKPSESKK